MAQADRRDKPLPFQIATMPTIGEELSVIHHRSQLMIARSRVARWAIADPSIIDVVQYSPNEIGVIGSALGSTTLTLWFENSPRPLIYLVKTIRDPSLEDQKRLDYGRLERKLQVLFPNSKVYLIPLSGKIVVKGEAYDAAEAARILQIVRGEVINQEGNLGGPQPAAGGTGAAVQTAGYTGTGLSALDLPSYRIVNMLKVPGEFQVMLRVRIAELNRSQLRQMGVDFSILFNNGRQMLSYAAGGLPATLSGIFENGDINLAVNWLATNGTAKILSEPVVTVLSGRSASFLSGGEFAVPTIIGIQGAQGQTTTFRGFGTSLVVTPTVIDKDLIRLQIVPEFSQINQNNAVNGIPGVDSRRVNTIVELREGQTIALAGLLSHQSNTNITRVPFLSAIPYVGSRLFASKQASQDQSELLILVSPEIVRPMDPDEVPPVPGHEVTHPNDYELYHAAMTEGSPDQRTYQLAPYGYSSGEGVEVPYRLFNPAPASPLNSPVPTNPYGADPYVSPPSHRPTGSPDNFRQRAMPRRTGPPQRSRSGSSLRRTAPHGPRPDPSSRYSLPVQPAVPPQPTSRSFQTPQSFRSSQSGQPSLRDRLASQWNPRRMIERVKASRFVSGRNRHVVPATVPGGQSRGSAIDRRLVFPKFGTARGSGSR